MRVELRIPTLADLPACRAALEAGYSPSNGRPRQRLDDLAAIAADPEAFVATQTDPEARGAPIEQPDGTKSPRLPGFVRWIFAEEAFAGTIGLRWQNGTEALPPHVLGHIGYSIVPDRRNRGIATRALALLLPEATAQGLRHVDLTTDPANIASQRVILANGGVLLGRFDKPSSHGGGVGLHWRIVLQDRS
ncbi:MAG: GNAT family N-acetyltransferase [Acidiphilium sp.]